uniref:Uncharacterized protein n=1 Tax=viral metagenome TaxID=1070528 RepID=A0A6M3XSD5_9ZZZZ
MSGITAKVQLDEKGKLLQSEEKEVREMSDLAEEMKQGDVTEKMYLEDIRTRDVDNLSLVLKASQWHQFPTVDGAAHFMGESLNRALLKLGCNALDLLRQKMAGKIDPKVSLFPGNPYIERVLQKQMLMRKVKCEHRAPGMYAPEEQWKSGMYIYHKNEIAYFISNPVKTEIKRKGVIYLASPEVAFVVKTNVPKG